MCGIYGILELGQHSRRPDEQRLSKMGGSLIHRGPDDEGHYLGDCIALGMRRLSIIDLEGGHQPISNERGTVWVVCNGEIYNYRELRADLEKRGHAFRSQSDTEVIVHLYEEEGLESFKKLRGMFAIAIWDTDRSRLVLVRDRLGKKPLYISRDPERLVFASEMKAILQDERISRELNFSALDEYLALGYVPAPLTLFKKIEKVLPGHYIIYEHNQVREQCYWDMILNRPRF